MPWDGCELWAGEIIGDGTIANQHVVAGGLRESIFQPEWSPDGTKFVFDAGSHGGIPEFKPTANIFTAGIDGRD